MIATKPATHHLSLVIPVELWQQLKLAAIDQHASMTEIIVSAVRKDLAAAKALSEEVTVT